MSDEFNIINTPAGPLDGAVFTSRSGTELLMRPLEQCARFSLRVSKDHLAKASRLLELDIPARIGRMSGSEKKVLCLGPDEWLVLAPEDERSDIISRFAQMSEQIPHALVDISHRNTGIEISGPGAALALNAGCPLNLDTLPVGECARTVMDKAQIVLLKLDKEHYRLEILRSFAEFVWQFLSMAGREFDVSSR